MPTDYEDYTDADLVRCYQKGDEAAGNTLCQRYWDTLHRFFKKKIGNSEVAKDLVQETLLAALKTLKNGKDRSPRHVRSWCYKIAARVLVRWFQEQKKQGSYVSLEDVIADAGIADASEQILFSEVFLASVGDHPEHEIIDAELGGIRRRFEGTLRGRELKIFRLRLEGTLTFRQIGEVVGIKTGAAKVQYHRTVVAFKEWLKKHYPETYRLLMEGGD